MKIKPEINEIQHKNCRKKKYGHVNQFTEKASEADKLLVGLIKN